MAQKLSRLLSTAFHPLVIPLYIILILLFSKTVYAPYPMRIKIYLLWVTALYSVVIPLLAGAFLRRLHKIGTIDIRGRRALLLMLLTVAVCYLLCAITFLKIPSLMLFRKIAFAAMLCALFCTAMAYFKRTSVHLTVMGAVVALFTIMNIVGALSLFWELLASIIIAGALASARLYMGRNNGTQILISFVGGYLISLFSILYI